MSEVIDKRPKDMTDDEIDALPTGPWIEHKREITPEDFAAGKRGRWIVTTLAPAQRATAWRKDDIFAYRDRQGHVWDFGQWADGQWFKQRSVLS